MAHPQINVKFIQDECGRRHKRNHYRHHSEGEVYIDTSTLWKAYNSEEEALFKAIKTSGIFAEDRKETFVKFNYRTMESKHISYGAVYEKLLSNTLRTKEQRPCLKGTMNVNELWSERNLQELIGSLPFPKDRLKVLDSYQKSKVMRIKHIRNKPKGK